MMKRKHVATFWFLFYVVPVLALVFSCEFVVSGRTHRFILRAVRVITDTSQSCFFLNSIKLCD